MASAPPVPTDHYEVTVGDGGENLDPLTAIRRVGRLLHFVIIAKDVSLACLAALERMAVSGEVLAVQFVEEIKSCGPLSKSVNCNWGDYQDTHGRLCGRHYDLETCAGVDDAVVRRPRSHQR